jgi:hypothetical protein
MRSHHRAALTRRSSFPGDTDQPNIKRKPSLFDGLFPDGSSDKKSSRRRRKKSLAAAAEAVTDTLFSLPRAASSSFRGLSETAAAVSEKLIAQLPANMLPPAASSSFRGVIDTSSVVSEKLARLPSFLLSRLAAAASSSSRTGSVAAAVVPSDLPIGGRLARLKARSVPRLVYMPDHRHNKPVLSSSSKYLASLNRPEKRKTGSEKEGATKKKKGKDPYKEAREKSRVDREFMEREILLKATLAFPPFPLTRVAPPPQTVLANGSGDDDDDLMLEYYSEQILEDVVNPDAAAARPLPKDAFATPYSPPVDTRPPPKRGKELWGGESSARKPLPKFNVTRFFKGSKLYDSLVDRDGDGDGTGRRRRGGGGGPARSQSARGGRPEGEGSVWGGSSSATSQRWEVAGGPLAQSGRSVATSARSGKRGARARPSTAPAGGRVAAEGGEDPRVFSMHRAFVT